MMSDDELTILVVVVVMTMIDEVHHSATHSMLAPGDAAVQELSAEEQTLLEELNHAFSVSD